MDALAYVPYVLHRDFLIIVCSFCLSFLFHKINMYASYISNEVIKMQSRAEFGKIVYDRVHRYSL
jgi:hypothetical protein